MRQVIVTGAGGFLGRHLVRDLRQHGARVTAIGREPRTAPGYVAMGDAPWDSSRLAEIIAGVQPDVIFHLVGGAAGSPAVLEMLNLSVAKTLMQAVQDARIRPLLVFAGSAAEYGKAIVDGVPVAETAVCAPVGAYGAVKLAQTNAALAFAEATGTPVLVARIFNPIGAGMPEYLALGEFARQIAQMCGDQGVLQTGNLEVFRDFLDVAHAAAVLRRLAQNPEARGIVNVCSGQATELRQLVQMLIDASTKHITIQTASSRLRADEPRTVIGSTGRLAELHAMPPPTDYAAVIARIRNDVEARWAHRP